MLASRNGRELHLAHRPRGWPSRDTFALVEVEVPEPAEGQVLVRNLFLSVDPYMRGRMNDVRSYVPPYTVGAVLDGGAVGVVVASGSPLHAVGDSVLHGLGWREYAVAEAAGVRKVDTMGVPASAYLSVLGMPGLTAYIGLVDIAEMRPGDTVFVSGGAGAVGSLVGQIARLRGAGRVIASTGSAEKVAYLEELGVDVALNYRDGSLSKQLAAAAPDGIDVYFDNVGGDHLETAISAMRPFGRIALCGGISQYNDVGPSPGPSNMMQVISKRIAMRGFIVGDHRDRTRDAIGEMTDWFRQDRLKMRETVVDGLENMPDAFLGMLRGENVGKMLVRLPDTGNRTGPGEVERHEVERQ